MVGERAILQSYLMDATRLASEARECVLQLIEQRGQLGRASPGQVQALLRVVHTLKGTSTMVRGGEPVVQALHGLESRLCTRPLIDLAARPDWIEDAALCVEQAKSALTDLHQRERITEAAGGLKEPELSRGILLRVVWAESGSPALHWFPLETVASALPLEDVEEQGAPVLGLVAGGPGTAVVALVLETAFGRIVLRAVEVAGWASWPEAEELGATRGLDALSGRVAQSQPLAA